MSHTFLQIPSNRQGYLVRENTMTIMVFKFPVCLECIPGSQGRRACAANPGEYTFNESGSLLAYMPVIGGKDNRKNRASGTSFILRAVGVLLPVLPGPGPPIVLCSTV